MKNQNIIISNIIRYDIEEIEVSKVKNMERNNKGYADKINRGDIWYKVSTGVFNAQAEVIASRLAKYTNLPSYVEYKICKVNGKYATKSKDFVKNRRTETTQSLHIKFTGTSIQSILSEISGLDLLKYVRNIILKSLNLDILSADNLAKLSLLLQFDAYVLNIDRHFGNIKFIQLENGVWEFAPAFDFDCALYSCADNLNILDYYKNASLPFCDTHKEQIELLYSLSNARLYLKSFGSEQLINGLWEDDYTVGKELILDYLHTLEKRCK